MNVGLVPLYRLVRARRGGSAYRRRLGALARPANGRSERAQIIGSAGAARPVPRADTGNTDWPVLGAATSPAPGGCRRTERLWHPPQGVAGYRACLGPQP